MMKKKVVAGFMAAMMMVSVMTTGVFAKDLDPTSETQRTGDTTVTATVEENSNKDCALTYEIMNNDASIQNGTWYSNGFLFNLFTGAGQEATDQLRLNRNQLYNKDLSVWGGQYTGTLNFYTKIVDVYAN